MDIEEIHKEVQELSNKVAEQSNENRDDHINSLIVAKIAAWEKRRGAIILVIAAIIGVTSWATLKEKVANYYASNVITKIDNEVKKKTAFSATQDLVIANLESQITDLKKTIEILQTTLSSIPKISIPKPVATQIPSNGFSFFGIRDFSGAWSEIHFDIVGGANRPPKAGDEVVAKGFVNIREGYITYGLTGWKNKPSKGVLKEGDRVIVDEAKDVAPGFWWIAFSRKK